MGVQTQKIVASLDIGSNKIVCLVGYINAMGKVCIKGIGHQQSNGIQDGKIINKKEAEKSILSAISIAEKIAGFNIQDIAINVNSSMLSSSVINTSINLNNKEVNDKDINNLLNDIKSILKKENKEIIHLIPLQYCIDNNIVENPYNIEGKELKIVFQLLSVEKNDLKKAKNSIKNMMLDINNYVSNGYANSLTVLNEKEKELGVLTVDIGYENTNIGLVYDNKYVFESNIPMGGKTITEDISNVLKITQATAEKIKVMNADFSLSKNDENELIKIKIDTDEDFEASKNKIKLINDITKARIDEIIELIMKKLKIANLENVPQYIVLTGGTSLIPNIDDYVSKISNLETRVAYNEDMAFIIQDRNLATELKNPIYSVSMGILKFLQSKALQKKSIENESGFFSILKKIFS